MTNKKTAQFWKSHLKNFQCTTEETQACKNSIAAIESLEELKRMCEKAEKTQDAEVYRLSRKQHPFDNGYLLGLKHACRFVKKAIDGKPGELKALAGEE